MNVICSFQGGDAGVFLGELDSTGDSAVAFMPYRSPAHLRLSEALARDGVATVELRGPGVAESRRVTAMTPHTITLAPPEPR